jgi:hypothetical protein
MGINEMTDVRCPMCSKSNPEDAEICAFCSARLKPLIIDEPSQEFPSPRADEPQPSEGADWLERIRAEVGSETPEEEAPQEEVLDEGTPPDWLGRLREAGTGEDEGPLGDEVPTWLQESEGEIKEEVEAVGSERLKSLREIEAQEPVKAEVESEPADDDWLARLREKEEDLPSEVIEEEPKPEVEFVEEALEGELLPSVDPGQIGDEEPVVKPEFIDSGDILPTPIETSAPITPSMEEPPPVVLPSIEGKPDWLADDVEITDEGLPHVPALIMDESDGSPPDEIPDINLDAIQLPDWLSDLGETTSPEGVLSEEASPGLARATLPTWLEAMRPIETFRSVVEIEPEGEQSVESAGPLAGLYGVLMAEPVVAKPRAATVGTTRLEVTERQFAQAEILQRMVEEEGIERPEAVAGRARLPILRWAIGFLLIFLVAVPMLLPLEGGLNLPLPSLVPRDLGQLINLVEDASIEQPVLVVFDYAPGYVGELSTVAEPLLHHIASRGLRVVSISTQANGPPLAEKLLSRISENGEGYIHMGYLSGGPTAVQLFAGAPLDTIAPGFLLPEDLASDSVWSSPILKSVRHFSDFSIVMVITSRMESARTWVEQANPWLDETPLVMVLSAGTEPLIRPYYEALEHNVDGILSGMPAAVGYAQLIGYEGDAQIRWNAFGMGIFAVELILLAGVVYGIASWLMKYRSG